MTKQKKRNTIVTFVTLAMFVLIFSLQACGNLTVPKKVEIKASPKIEASLGEVGVDLTEYLNIQKIKELMGPNENLEIYEYNEKAGDNELRFLAKMNYEMPIEGLDIQSYLNQLTNMEPIKFGYEKNGDEFAKDENGNLIPQTLFSIPEINHPIDLSGLNLDFGEKITIPSGSLTIPAKEADTPVVLDKLPPVDITVCSDNTFSTLEIGTGSLDLTFAAIENPSSGFTAEVSEITLLDGENVIATSSVPANLITGGKTSINLAGKQLPKKLKFKMKVAVNGGVTGKNFNINVSYSMNNLSIAKIHGFNKTFDIPFPTMEPIPLGQNASLLQAVIGEGSIGLTLNNIPQNIKVSPTLTISQADNIIKGTTYTGLKIDNEPIVNGKLDLANKNLNTGNITVGGNIKIEATNATIDLSKKISASANFEIKNLQKVKVDSSIIPANMTTMEYSYSLAQVAEYVNSIKFKEVGLKLRACNGTPLDINLNVSSKFLNLNNERKNIPGGQTVLPAPENAINITKTNLSIPLKKPNPPDQLETGSMFDIKLALDIGNSTTPGVIEINNINTGTDFKLYGEAALVADWVSVNFILPDGYSNFNGTYPEKNAPGMDLSILREFFKEDLSIDGIRPMLFAYSDLLKEGGPLSSAKIETYLKADYTTEVNGKEENKSFDLVGTADKAEQLNICKEPTLTVDPKNEVVTGLLPDNKHTSLEVTNFTDLLTKGPKDLHISYDVKLGGGKTQEGIEITYDSIKDLPDATSIKLCMLIDLPFRLKVKQNTQGYAAIDIGAFIPKSVPAQPDPNADPNAPPVPPADTNGETDLLQRAPGATIEGLNTVLDYLNKVAINMDYENKTGLALELAIKDENPDNHNKFEKILKVGKGKGVLDFSLDYNDAKYIMDTNPFYPDLMELRIPGNDTTHSLRKDAGLKVNLKCAVETDVNISIPLTGSEQSPAGSDPNGSTANPEGGK